MSDPAPVSCENLDRGALPATPKGGALLCVENLAVEFRRRRSASPKPILRGVNLAVGPRERVGLVGRSGSGKSMTSLAILGLLPPGTRIVAGGVAWRGSNVHAPDFAFRSRYCGTEVSMVFQDPVGSLNPVLTVRSQIEYLLHRHRGVPRDGLAAAARQMLADVGFDDPDAVLPQHPHELSGGMAQRVMIALALACQPKLLIADEPTSALDVVSQEDILKLLSAVTRQHDMALLLISHDLRVVSRLCTRIAVMEEGRIVESGPTGEVLRKPRERATVTLMEAAAFQAPPGGTGG